MWTKLSNSGTFVVPWSWTFSILSSLPGSRFAQDLQSKNLSAQSSPELKLRVILLASKYSFLIKVVVINVWGNKNLLPPLHWHVSVGDYCCTTTTATTTSITATATRPVFQKSRPHPILGRFRHLRNFRHFCCHFRHFLFILEIHQNVSLVGMGRMIWRLGDETAQCENGHPDFGLKVIIFFQNRANFMRNLVSWET